VVLFIIKHGGSAKLKMFSLEELVRQQAMMLENMQQQLSILSTRTTGTQQANHAINVPWPAPLNVNSDPEEAFNIFKESWKNYCRATEMETWSTNQEARKISVLMSAIGEEAIKKYNNFGIQESDNTCEIILNVISSKMVPKKNVIYNRYIFNSRNQGEENFDLYYSELIKLVDDCNFKDLRDELLRDKIVFGIKDISLKKDLLKRENLTLNDAVNQCRASEITERQVKTLAQPEIIKKIKEDTPMKACKFCANKHLSKKVYARHGAKLARYVTEKIIPKKFARRNLQ
jgi:hypothetical protein